MSKTFARSSLCALSMTIMTAHAAEPDELVINPKSAGRCGGLVWLATSSAARV